MAPAQGSPASVSPESPYGALRPLPGPFSPSESTKGQEVPRDLQVRALKDALAWANSGTYSGGSGALVVGVVEERSSGT